MKKTILSMSALLLAGGMAAAQTAPAPGAPQTAPPASQNQISPGVTPPAGLEPANRPPATGLGAGTTGTGTTGTATTSPLPAPRADVDASGPLPGANSFTANQARERLETGGFSGVTNLRKDAQGIWRGTAMRNGVSVPVAVDYRGNIFQQ
jgi:hypothetical protein